MDPTIQTAIIAALVTMAVKGLELVAARNKTRTESTVGLRQAELESDRQYRASLDADETEFRKTLLGENRALTTDLATERRLRNELAETVKVQGKKIDEQDERLTSVTKQLTVITGERDLEKRRADRLESELGAAKRRILELEREVSLLRVGRAISEGERGE